MRFRVSCAVSSFFCPANLGVDVHVHGMKVNDDEGNLYKFKASAERLDRVLQAVSEKLRMPKDAILLKYQDDDGDDIVLSG